MSVQTNAPQNGVVTCVELSSFAASQLRRGTCDGGGQQTFSSLPSRSRSLPLKWSLSDSCFPFFSPNLPDSNSAELLLSECENRTGPCAGGGGGGRPEQGGEKAASKGGDTEGDAFEVDSKGIRSGCSKLTFEVRRGRSFLKGKFGGNGKPAACCLSFSTMAPSSTAMRSEAKSPQVKYKGIHEPKGRVKGFRVEIRPPGSSKKIWVGTFDTRAKAKRAYDAAVYLTGKEPFYFVYPEGYFSSRSPTPSKEDVQTLAKKFAEKTDDLAESVASCLGASSKAGQARNVGTERTSPNTTIVKKVAEKMNSPLLPDPLKTLEGLDQFLQQAEYLEVPTLLDWTSLDCLPVQSKEVMEESKVDLEKSAYHRGFTSKQDIWKSLSDVPLPAPYDFPAIEDESSYLNFYTPLEVSSTDGASQETDSFTNLVDDLGFSEGFSAVEDDWCSCSNGSWV